MEKPLDFIEYPTPRNGTFKVETKEANETFTYNWCLRQETIIGETSIVYVTRLEPFIIGYWIKGKVIQYTSTVAIGINKSRLINWQPYQLRLF